MDNAVLKNKQLWLIFSITTIAVMGVASFMAAYPKIADHFRVSPDRVALISTIFTLPGLLLTPIFGVIADKIGRKQILVPALLLFGIAGSSIIFVNNFNLFLACIFLQGMGAAPLGALNVTLISDKFSGSDRIAALGYNGTILNLSTTIYPFLGGILAGFGWYYPFFLPLLAIIVMFPILFFLQDEHANKLNFSDYFSAFSSTLKNKKVLAILSIAVITFLILFGTLISFLPFLIAGMGIKNPIFIGLQVATMSVMAAISSSQLKRINKYLSQKQLLIIAFILYGISSFLVIFFEQPWLLFISSSIYGIGHGVNIPSLISILSQTVPKEQLAGFMSLHRASSLLGQTTAPIIFAIFYRSFGIHSTFILGAILAILAVLIILFFINHNQKV